MAGVFEFAGGVYAAFRVVWMDETMSGCGCKITMNCHMRCGLYGGTQEHEPWSGLVVKSTKYDIILNMFERGIRHRYR